MTMITITRIGTVTAADDDTMSTSQGVGSTPRAMAVDAPVAHVETLKAMLADALSMLERAEIIDFNGHMSARLPGTDRVLINAGASVRSALTARDIVTIDLDGRPADLRALLSSM